MTQSALEILDISHNFGGIRVLSSLNFKVTDGSIVGLLGPNGSGKSTLFNVLSGFIKPAKGDALLFGRPLNALSVEQRCAQGMLRTFQTPKLFENMTVLENLMAGAYSQSTGGLLAGMFAFPSARNEMIRMRNMAEGLASRFGLTAVLQEKAGKLTGGQRRLLEIVRVYATAPKVLMLDEPSTGLSAEEIVQLMDLLKLFNSEGMTIFLVSHDMHLMSIASEVHVLYFGELIASGSMEEVKSNALVREVYLGA